MDEKKVLTSKITSDFFSIIINVNTKTIEELYDNNNLIAKNLSYEQYCEKISEIKKFDTETLDRIYKSLNNFNSNKEDFSFQTTFSFTNGETAIYYVIVTLIAENRYNILMQRKSKNIKRNFDDLTKLYNLSMFKDRLALDIKANRKLLFMIIDVDNFTMINKTFGFMFGDIVLVRLAAALKNVMSENGYVGRIIGDQFAAYKYIDNADMDYIAKECAMFRNSITDISKTNVAKAKITATMGAVIYPDQAKDMDDIFLKANKALARGKYKGKNCYVIYSQLCEDVKYKIEVPKEDVVDSPITDSGEIVASVFEILNASNDIEKSIYECFILVASFFQLDRITMTYSIETNINHTNHVNIEWTNPFYPELKGLLSEKYNNYDFTELKTEFDKVMKDGMLKINQIDSKKDLGYVYDRLKEVKTQAIFMNNLVYLGKTFGVIRYEKCFIDRFWDIKDTSPLYIITRMLSMAIYKKAEQANLERMITYDKITGLFNYSKWRDEIDTFILNESRYPNFAIVSSCVLNYSKIVAKYGISAGDDILLKIAEALNVNINNDYICCRVNDDKFMIFIANKTRNEIENFINEIENYVSKQFDNINIILLFGINIHRNLETINDCIDYANLALKNSNNLHNISYFEDDLIERMQYKLDIESHMKEALEKNEFMLFLQPKIDSITNEIVGAEALTRWNYYFEKILFPNDFIPIFEENGFVNDLDYVVFENVCIFLRKCIDSGYKPLKISVNISRSKKDFNEYLNRLNVIRKKYNIEAKYIEVEITESMYNENTEAISEFIKNLHNNGYYVSMDDFGTGYSNLASLSNFDFDIIKLDKSFCNDIHNDKKKKILSFVIALANELNTDVLCEGVETEELVEDLKKLGCHLVQGYYYSKPIPEKDFVDKYLKNK